MKVIKFGGTSLANADRIKHVSKIISREENCIVVCSAMSGVTNKLTEAVTKWRNEFSTEAEAILSDIFLNFDKEIRILFEGENHLLHKTSEKNDYYHQQGKNILSEKYTPEKGNYFLALGELVTSVIINNYLRMKGTDAFLLHAPDFIVLNDQREPELRDIAKRLHKSASFSEEGVYITQGFICSDQHGQTDNLQRGGSDYTATLLGAAIMATAVEIWTDIDGLHNNDPRYISNTKPVRELSYAEASELAYFGAKILHPACVRPARERQIPVFLKNTLNPSACGTVIRKNNAPKRVKSIAAKDNITIVRITSGRMFNAFGFLKKLFEVYEKLEIPVDVITTSEVSVSMTIDSDKKLDKLVKELTKLGRVEVETQQCIICVVGDVLHHVSQITELLKDIPLKMISLGASSNNITFVLPQEHKTAALECLHNIFSNVYQNKQHHVSV